VAAFSILYLVHDLSDPSVLRRVTMLKAGGAAVTLMGFRRNAEPVSTVGGCPAYDLGQTHNGRFVQRILAVIMAVLKLEKQRHHFASADLIIARNLEMLGIGVRGRSLTKPLKPLIYESLDIHRLLLRSDAIGKALRWLEGWLSRRASLLITSSPAFVRHYFTPLSNVRLPHLLIENKVFLPEAHIAPLPMARAASTPWKIGWFGAIRCRKSLEILKRLVAKYPGNVEVIIRGKPAYDQFDDFETQVRTTPGISFHGPYRNPDDLPAIYGEVHFSWCIDMFEEGQNSSWLLPNRIYEGGLFATVPIAQRKVETGRTLEEMGLGIQLDDPLEPSLDQFMSHLGEPQYQQLQQAALSIPRQRWLHDNEACIELVAYLKTI
jgi:succinoglycan biosynthesis protein ExoL